MWHIIYFRNTEFLIDFLTAYNNMESGKFLINNAVEMQNMYLFKFLWLIYQNSIDIFSFDIFR